MTDVELGLLYSNTWNHFTMKKKWALARLKKVIFKMFTNIFDVYV